MRIGWRIDKPPEEQDYYLVQYESGNFDICEWTNVMWFGTKHITDWHWEAKQYCKVQAWMPLPEPYNIESDVKE